MNPSHDDHLINCCVLTLNDTNIKTFQTFKSFTNQNYYVSSAPVKKYHCNEMFSIFMLRFWLSLMHFISRRSWAHNKALDISISTLSSVLTHQIYIVCETQFRNAGHVSERSINIIKQAPTFSNILSLLSGRVHVLEPVNMRASEV